METCKILTHLAANEVLGITSNVRDLKRSINLQRTVQSDTDSGRHRQNCQDHDEGKVPSHDATPYGYLRMGGGRADP